MLKHARFLLILIAVAVTGCTTGYSGSLSARPIGDAERGRVLFSQVTIRSTPGCITCHSLERGKVVVGPSLAGIASRAPSIIQSSGYSGTATTPEEFLRESITRPGAAVETGFSHSVMPDWLTVLDRQEIEDPVAFLSSLR